MESLWDGIFSVGVLAVERAPSKSTDVHGGRKANENREAHIYGDRRCPQEGSRGQEHSKEDRLHCATRMQQAMQGMGGHSYKRSAVRFDCWGTAKGKVLLQQQQALACTQVSRPIRQGSHHSTDGSSTKDEKAAPAAGVGLACVWISRLPSFRWMPREATSAR
ncbi:hypothetical protein EBH_0080760 [Eimeria brunetti]|uniref:Uncharacterized protein n=1 Tax=Eimeria brunetti TaxID=51314 RepID=U6LVE9_9EIME|nr:hypothetical protein EBH_0080760 [Eimeria brunetti]